MAEFIESRRINLTALQRIDSLIIDIIDNASQVALYQFNQTTDQWEVTDIEGSMFLYRRSHAPYHGFVIMNRMNTTNLVEPFVAGLDFQVKKPYLLYKNKSDVIYGTWFYEQRDFVRMTSKIQRIIRAMCMRAKLHKQSCAFESESRKGPIKATSASTDIISLLAHAQLEFEKKNMPAKMSNGTMESTQDYNILSSCSEKHITDKHLLSSEKHDPKARQVTDGKDSHQTPRRRFLSCTESTISHTDCSSKSSKQAPLHTESHCNAAEHTTFGTSESINNVNKAKITSQNKRTTNGKKLSKCSSHSNFPETRPMKSSSMKTPRVISSPGTETAELGTSTAKSKSLNLKTFASPITPLKPPYILAEPHFSTGTLKEKHFSGDSDMDSSFETRKTGNEKMNSKEEILKDKKCIVETFIHLLKNDSSIFLKLHKGYISSLQTHINRCNK